MDELVLFIVDFQEKVVVHVGKGLIIENGEVEGLRSPYGDVPETSLVALVQQEGMLL